VKRAKWLRAELTIQGWAGAQLSLLGTNGVDALGRRTHNSLFEIAKGEEWRKGWRVAERVERGTEICCRKCFWKKVTVIVGGVERFLYICSPQRVETEIIFVFLELSSFNDRMNFIVLNY